VSGLFNSATSTTSGKVNFDKRASISGGTGVLGIESRVIAAFGGLQN
jgi:hypothetical protein